MRKRLLIGALCLVGVLAIELSGPSFPAIPLAHGITTVSQSDAAVGRGGGSEEGSGGNVLQVGPRTANILKSVGVPLLFVMTAGALAWAAVQRSMGSALVVIVLAVVIGAFLLAPGQMKQTFLSIYQYVL